MDPPLSRTDPATQRALGETLPASDDASPLKPGTILAERYEVHRELGRGGMGVVYQAHDHKLARGVALKVLHSEIRSPRARARIRREAQTAAGIRHPNVVNIFDIGQFGDSDYISMELIDGVDLRTWLRDPTLSWQEIVQVFLAAGDGLCAAHAQGLVHRDFKPDNVLIERSGRVRVLDFGLARPIADDEVADVQQTIHAHTKDLAIGVVTRTGALVGTPAYMAPEQFSGGLIDARTDVFGFCVALHEALYGHRPFRASSVAELALQVEAGAIVPATPMRESRPPTAIRQLLVQGLNPDRQIRPELPDLLKLLRLGADPKRGRLPVVLAVASLAAVVLIAATRLPGSVEPVPGVVEDGSEPTQAAEKRDTPPEPSAERAAAAPPIELDAAIGDQTCDRPWDITLVGDWPKNATTRLLWRSADDQNAFATISVARDGRTFSIPAKAHQNHALEFYGQLSDADDSVLATVGSKDAPRRIDAPTCPSKSTYRRWCWENPNMGGDRTCWPTRGKCEADAREWLGPGKRRCRGQR